MSNENGTTVPGQAQGAGFAETKGKGKASAVTGNEAPDSSMVEDDDEDDEEDDGEEPEPEQEDEDNMEEIDLSNVVGTRTRGKKIDFAKAAQENPADDDDDEEDDEDFQGEAEDEDRMDED